MSENFRDYFPPIKETTKRPKKPNPIVCFFFPSVQDKFVKEYDNYLFLKFSKIYNKRYRKLFGSLRKSTVKSTRMEPPMPPHVRYVFDGVILNRAFIKCRVRDQLIAAKRSEWNRWYDALDTYKNK